MARGRPKKDGEQAPAQVPEVSQDTLEVSVSENTGSGSQSYRPDPGIIHPSIKVHGSPKHPLQKLFEEHPDKLPVMKAVGYCLLPGTNQYLPYTLHVKGDRVLKIEVEEPNLRSIAEESAKIAFVDTLMVTDDV